MNIYRNNKIEFCGNKKEVIQYIEECYGDDYFIEQNIGKFNKDWELFKFCLTNLGLSLKKTK